MELYIYDKSFELQGIIDVYECLIWTRRYHECGQFELHVLVTTDNLSLLRKDNIIYKNDDCEAGFIESGKTTVDKSGKEILVVYGKFITAYLNRRVILNSISWNGTYENLMRKMVQDNCTTGKRAIPFLELGEFKNYTDSLITQISNKSVLDKNIELSNDSNLGFRLDVFPDIKKIEYEVYKGVDRSSSQSIVSPVIFSRSLENIISLEYSFSKSNYKNVAIIAGAGEGTERKRTIINDDAEGLDRYELFVDARDIQKTKDVTSTDNNGQETTIQEEIPDAEYIELLDQRGYEKLEECKETSTFDSTVDTYADNAVYKEDYELGDIVTVKDDEWGLKLDTRITEVVETYENGNRSVNPVFGYNIPTIVDKIKKLERK